MSLIQEAMRNWLDFRERKYPGRIIVLGTSQDGKSLVQIYAIMGRSPNSRNRIFVATDEDGMVATEASNPAEMKDPSLVIYTAMREDVHHGFYVVSNGHQTNTTLANLKDGLTLSEALGSWVYEPDEPNFTPRITGYHNNATGNAQLSMLRKSPWNDTAQRFVYEYENIAAGYGFAISTYLDDGEPLPSFSGEPLLLSVSGDINTVAEGLWSALDPENKVALCVKFIDRDTGKSELRIMNKYQKV